MRIEKLKKFVDNKTNNDNAIYDFQSLCWLIILKQKLN